MIPVSYKAAAMTAMAARAPPTMRPVAAAAAPVKVEAEVLGVTDEALIVELLAEEPEPTTPPDEGAVVTAGPVVDKDTRELPAAAELDPEAEALAESLPTPFPAP